MSPHDQASAYGKCSREIWSITIHRMDQSAIQAKEKEDRAEPSSADTCTRGRFYSWLAGSLCISYFLGWSADLHLELKCTLQGVDSSIFD